MAIQNALRRFGPAASFPPMPAGRNDLCPCGSGRKYKRCCLAKDKRASNLQLVRDDEPVDSSPPPPGARWEVDLDPVPGTLGHGVPDDMANDVADSFDVLTSALPVGPGAAPEAAVDEHDPDDLRHRHEPLLRAFESALVASGLSAPTVRRHAMNALLLTSFLADHGLPLHAMTEYDLRIFLHDWSVAKVMAPRGDKQAVPVSLKRFFRFVGEHEGVFFPWAAPILADRAALHGRIESFPGGMFLDDAVREWQGVVTIDLALRELLPAGQMASGDRWGSLMGPLEWKLQRELQRRWLLWREQLIASGLAEAIDVRMELIELQRRWESRAHPDHGDLTPIEVVMQERQAAGGRTV